MMLSSLVLTVLLAGSSLAGPHVFNAADIEKIEKEMSREVEEEFSGKEQQEELKLLRAQFAASHTENITYMHIPTELDINARNNTALFEGDIELTPEQWKVALDYDPANPMRRRQALTSTYDMWQPMGAPVIPYTFVPGFPQQYYPVIRDALAFWEQRTCVKYRQATNYDANAVIFNHNAAGCSSMVGRVRGQRQYLNLGNGCMSVGIAAHELSHAFGTLHVQSRPDRDNFVTIDSWNIQRGTEHNFKMEPHSSYSTYDIPYEFGSMQHYNAYAFSVDTRRPTIFARPQYQRFQGSMDAPRATFFDILLINRMYKCTDKCPRQMQCANGGVTHGADCNKCFCPKGWAGTTCNQRPAGTQIVNVAANPQNVNIAMSGQFTSFQERIIVLQAPAGRKIEATVRNFQGFWSTDCRPAALEVIPFKDTRYSGFRFCAQPNAQPIVSDGDTMVLYMYRDRGYSISSDVSVRAV